MQYRLADKRLPWHAGSPCLTVLLTRSASQSSADGRSAEAARRGFAPGQQGRPADGDNVIGGAARRRTTAIRDPPSSERRVALHPKAELHSKTALNPKMALHRKTAVKSTKEGVR